MSVYTVEDSTTGKRVTFDWAGKVPPTDADMAEVFAAAKGGTALPPSSAPAVPSAPEFNPDMYPMDAGAAQAARPLLETGGLLFGGAAGGVPGAALGYGIGKGLSDVAEGVAPKTPGAALLGGARDVATGATMEMGGQVAGKVMSGAIGGLGKLGKQVIGRVTGAGPGAAEEAVKGGKAFTDAMRGETKPEEIVATAKEALSAIKDKRASAYQEQLAKIRGGQEIDITPIQMKMAELMKRYGVRVEADGSLNMTRTSLGKAGNKDVEDIVQAIRGWGAQKGDKTPVGLDTLKRQLDDFYSDSSNARGFVTALRNEVKGTLVKSVPEYATMTKDYAEATSLIKDIESGLMLRKQGMTGRVVADQTLRRLMSSMRDNFELRRELLGILGSQGGQDLTGQVAGYSMNALLPRGLAGITPSLAGTAAALNYLNPQWLPLIAASSPRVAGEFLRMVGIASRGGAGIPQAAGKAAAYLTVPPATNLLTDK